MSLQSEAESSTQLSSRVEALEKEKREIEDKSNKLKLLAMKSKKESAELKNKVNSL